MKQKGFAAPIILIAVIAFIAAFGAVWYFNKPSISRPTQFAPVIQNITPSKLESTQIIPTLAVDETKDWKTEKIGLYSLQLSIPNDWSIKEINRRPEPQSFYSVQLGHDCAKYVISNSNQDTQINLAPVCGDADGGCPELPSNAVLVKKMPYEEIYRITSESSNQDYYYYYYGTSSLRAATLGDMNGTIRQARTICLFTDLGENSNKIQSMIDLTFKGMPNVKDLNLKIADQIIASIK